MELLESAMAFAVAMIMFSTIATGIVEMFLRVVGARESTLQKTIESLFDTVIWPRLKSELAKASDQAAARENFVKAMVGNPAVGGTAGPKPDSFSILHSKRIDALTVLAFAERLGRTDVGKAVMAEGKAQLDLLVQDFVRSFDRFCRASTEVFRKKAQLVSIIVGIILAFAVNIEAARLMTAFINNPNLRTQLISQVDKAYEANQKASEKLAAVSEQVAAGKLEGDQVPIIKQQLDDLQRNLDSLRGLGLPVGWNFFPYCLDREGSKPDKICDAIAKKSVWNWDFAHLPAYLTWFVLTIVAGVLIGLGGPFWFRVFTSLSQLLQMLRAIGVGRAAAEKPAVGAAVQTAEESAKPKDVVDAFMVAASVHAHGSAPSERALLGPHGERI